MVAKLLTIDELRALLDEQQLKQTENTICIDDVFSEDAKKSREELIGLLMMIPDFDDEEKQLIINAFEQAFAICAEDCIKFGIELGIKEAKKGLI